MPDFRTGAESAEASAEAARFAGAVDFLRLKDRETAFLRFVTEKDSLIDITMHPATPTKKNPPAGFKGTWPPKMSAVCQNDSAFRLPGPEGPRTGEYEPGMGHCYIHEHMAGLKNDWGQPLSRPVAMVWGLAVLREEVIGSDGRPSGFTDKTEEWTDKDGKKHALPAIRFVQQRWGNFYSAVAAAAYISGTICDRDFKVTRSGNDYTISAVAQTPDHAPGSPSWARYDQAMELRGISLGARVAEQASPEYYARFFIPDAEGGAEEAPDAAPPTDAEQAEIEAQVAALRERLGSRAPVTSS
jgi:hypothetical protein